MSIVFISLNVVTPLSQLTTFCSSALQVTLYIRQCSCLQLFLEKFLKVWLVWMITFFFLRQDLSSPGEPWTFTSSSPVLGWPARMSHHIRLGFNWKVSKNLIEWLMPVLWLLERLWDKGQPWLWSETVRNKEGVGWGKNSNSSRPLNRPTNPGTAEDQQALRQTGKWLTACIVTVSCGYQNAVKGCSTC